MVPKIFSTKGVNSRKENTFIDKDYLLFSRVWQGFAVKFLIYCVLERRREVKIWTTTLLHHKPSMSESCLRLRV